MRPALQRDAHPLPRRIADAERTRNLRRKLRGARIARGCDRVDEIDRNLTHQIKREQIGEEGMAQRMSVRNAGIGSRAVAAAALKAAVAQQIARLVRKRLLSSGERIDDVIERARATVGG